jgi:hypothetical protein
MVRIVCEADKSSLRGPPWCSVSVSVLDILGQFVNTSKPNKPGYESVVISGDSAACFMTNLQSGEGEATCLLDVCSRGSIGLSLKRLFRTTA